MNILKNITNIIKHGNIKGTISKKNKEIVDYAFARSIVIEGLCIDTFTHHVMGKRVVNILTLTNVWEYIFSQSSSVDGIIKLTWLLSLQDNTIIGEYYTYRRQILKEILQTELLNLKYDNVTLNDNTLVFTNSRIGIRYTYYIRSSELYISEWCDDNRDFINIILEPRGDISKNIMQLVFECIDKENELHKYRTALRELYKTLSPLSDTVQFWNTDLVVNGIKRFNESMKYNKSVAIETGQTLKHLLLLFEKGVNSVFELLHDVDSWKILYKEDDTFVVQSLVHNQLIVKLDTSFLDDITETFRVKNRKDIIDDYMDLLMIPVYKLRDRLNMKYIPAKLWYITEDVNRILT